METTDYQKQAQDFLTETGTEFKAEFAGTDYYFDVEVLEGRAA